MYGGRVKRIELAKKLAVVLLCAVIIFVSIKKLTTKEVVYDPNGRYEYIKSYFASNGYTCEDLTSSGGRCNKDKGLFKSEFVRAKDGFTFLDAGEDYVVNIYYTKDTINKNGIFLRTNASALAGYQKKNYTCTTKGTIIDELDKCVDEEGNELDSGAYKNYVQKAIMTVQGAINASGYDKKALIEDFKWVRVN